jgi:hypothetical protein
MKPSSKTIPSKYSAFKLPKQDLYNSISRALLDACANGNLEESKRIERMISENNLSAPYLVNMTNQDGNTPLMLTIKNYKHETNRLRIIRGLLILEAEPNLFNNAGQNALMIASGEVLSRSIINTIMNHSTTFADPLATNVENQNSMSVASDKMKQKLIKYTITSKAKTLDGLTKLRNYLNAEENSELKSNIDPVNLAILDHNIYSLQNSMEISLAAEEEGRYSHRQSLKFRPYNESYSR